MKKETKTKREKINKILKVLASLIIIVTIFFMVKNNIHNTDEITTITKSAGVFGPIVLIILIMLGILFSPIPSVVIIVAAGYIYGPFWGAIYSYIGHMLGSNGVYFAVKRFHILKNSEKFKKYEKFVEKNKNMLYLFYGIPIIPITITSIIAATSKIKTKKFFQITLISFIPAVLLFSFLGGRMLNRNTIEIGIIAIVVFITGIIVVNKQRSKIEETLDQQLEKNIKKVKQKQNEKVIENKSNKTAKTNSKK